ncbi:chaperone protein DnaJ isoform X2 [Macadamia integrifolia]|uniref:chaperone protein DnaJ isoform X2 n=1 Tax=Macadamia integrifolia TaxID=60698 RepID=UPI001C4E95F7|nr:chaperone protein DnaJ isoform X2 [Macadamia integrifolia]
MQGDEAREVLGFPPNSRPTPLQVKAAYKRRAWETHPDRFPAHDKFHAESKFKLISEAYSCLRTGSVQGGSTSGHIKGKKKLILLTTPFFLKTHQNTLLIPRIFYMWTMAWNGA